MENNGTAAQIISILEKQNAILDDVLAEQAKIRIAVSRKDWNALQECILRIQKFSDSFIIMETRRSQLSEGISISTVPEAVSVTASVRSKLIKSKAENKALGDYVHITQGFLQNILDTIIPQRRNTLYSRKGHIVRPKPESVVLNKLF
jgi:hypothetical protein